MQPKSLTLYLKTWVQRGSTQPPILLVGSPQTTFATATSIAKTILGDAKLHPDYIEHTEEEPHTIALVRALEEKLARRPLHGMLVVVIPALEKMSVSASQALLKTLEEPAQSTRFILTTAFPRRLLPTILSRCTRFNLDQTFESQQDSKLNIEDIDSIKNFLAFRLQHNGPSPELRRAFQRLRDYYKITALKGNSKLAKEILVASLREIRYV